MLRLAFKSLFGHKLRMVLTALSIIIGVAFVSGSFIFTDSISSSFEDVFEGAYSNVDVLVAPQIESFSEFERPSLVQTSNLTLPNGTLQTVQGHPDVARSEGSVTGVPFLFSAQGEQLGLPNAPSFGFSWVTEPDFNILRIVFGTAPVAAGQVAIDRATAERNDLVIGDTVTVQAAAQAETFEIVGFVALGGDDQEFSGPVISAYALEDAQRIFDVDGYTQISVDAVDGVEPQAMRDNLAAILPQEGISVVTAEQQTSNDLEQINQGLGFLNTALLSFALIAVFVGAFIIQNTFRIIVAQRSKELAMLRSIGATRSQVLRVVLYEALIVAVISSVIGIFAGMGLSALLRWGAGLAGIALPSGSLTVEPRTIWASLIVGVVVTLYSALLPAYKASKVPPIEAMRETITPPKSLRRRALVGLAIVVFGGLLLAYGLFSADDSVAQIAGTGAVLMYAGVAVSAPLLSGPIASIAGIPATAALGVTGKIAQQNARRTPRRTASTASALMIGVSLVVFASVFAASTKATIDDIIGSTFPGDIMVISKNIQTDPFGATFSADVAEQVGGLPELEVVSAIKYNFAKIANNEELVIAIDPATFDAVISLNPATGSYDALTAQTVYVKDTTLEDSGLRVGDSIEFEFPGTGVQSLVIADSFSEAFDGPYVISSELYEQQFFSDDDLYLVANVADGTSVQDAKDVIETGVLAGYPILQTQDRNELVGQARTQIDSALGLLSVLLALAILVAVLGIINTLILSVSERTREIGMLRAIGLSRSQVFGMISSEGVIIAVFGVLLGIVMGTFLAWAMLQALKDLGFSVFSFPVGQIAIYVLAAIIAGSAAAIIPARRASRMNILDAINYE